MKYLVGILFTVSLYSTDTIDIESKVIRHFGGLSQNELNLPKSIRYTAPIAITQKVFEAKTIEDIETQAQKQKINEGIKENLPNAFLEDTQGRLFGGLSQNKIINK